MKLKELVKGKEAKRILDYLLENFEGEGKYLGLSVAGYYKEDEYYLCFDNTYNNCYVEQTKSLLLARKWCLQKIEADELYN